MVCQLIVGLIEDKNAEDQSGITPFQLAQSNGHSLVAQLIFSSISCIDRQILDSTYMDVSYSFPFSFLKIQNWYWHTFRIDLCNSTRAKQWLKNKK